MYHYIEDKAFLKAMRSRCSDIVNQLVQRINNDEQLTVEAHLVGSGARNLITQNENSPIDLDYNLCIIDSNNININDGRRIKEYIQSHFNAVLKRNGWHNCQDSTSALTTKRYRLKGNNTEFSIDLAIVRIHKNTWSRLIHRKTGNVQSDQWYWNEAGQSTNLTHRIDAIKCNHLWNAVRDTYLKKKNMYLCKHDRDHPSFVVYIEAVNEIYYQNFK